MESCKWQSTVGTAYRKRAQERLESCVELEGRGSLWLGVLRSLGLFYLYTVGIAEEYS